MIIIIIIIEEGKAVKMGFRKENGKKEEEIREVEEGSKKRRK